MLYVFHVETGTMMTFDMNLAMESVSSLQSVIHRGCKIPEDKQVLLVSGGESLDPGATVGKYHAGTDTNPIFLFSKSTIEAATPPSPSVNYGSDIDLQGQVEGSLLMPPAYQTVVSRAQLALQFQDVDGEELRACERLIHDQHLQQQGWAAVVANLEDVTSDLRQRFENFLEAYTQYLESRESYRSTLKRVSESLQLLAKIPVLPCLSQQSDGETACDSSTEDQEKYTLYDWISSQDANHSLHDMVEQCNKATEQLDQNVGETLRGEVDQMFKDVHNASMKEVKGLEDRLYGLDQIISGARKIVQQQSELAQGFVHNQNRLSNVRDMSILPDLCSSHRSQLLEMLKNHTKIREIKKKCRMAKEELSVNLHTRLRWVMYVEKKICDVDGKLTIYLGNLKRLNKRLDILQQVHDAPKVYGQFVTEIVRRRQFSKKFLSWAATLADDTSQLQLDEIRRREAFIIEIGRHFLQSMFQGLEEYPPAFATEAPSPFDQNLPEITADDVKELQEAVPELNEVLSVPEEEDLFHIVSIRKDPSVEWVDHAEHSLQVPQRPNQSQLTLQPRSLGGSEVDMLYGEHVQFKSLEGGSISLGEQFTECNKEPEIVVQPDVGVMSPTDKEEFLLPQSLSEALTLEMKQSNRRKSGEFSPKLTTSEKQDLHTKLQPANLPISSVTTAKEPTGERLPSIKSPLCQSPDLESLEFATADFYIDESMPSSIESPPKTSNTSTTEDKSIASTSDKIIDPEKVIKENYESQLKEYKRKLNEVENATKSLQKMVLETVPELKGLTLKLKTEQTEMSNSFNSDMVKLKETCDTVITDFFSCMENSNQSDLDKLQSEKDEIEMMLKDEIEAEQAKCAELRNELELAQKERLGNEESLKNKLEKAQQEQNEMIAKHDRELKELIQKHELEMEVEIDKLNAELSDKHTGLEKELERSVITVQDKDTAIESLKKDKVKTEETLMEKFQIEKEKICDILSKEHEEKLNQALKAQTEKLEQEKNVLKDELKKMHESDTQKKLEELRQSMMVEKQQEIDLTQSTMTLEHNKLTEELRNKTMEEKASELERIKSELEIKFQEDLAKFSSEFNREKEVLVAELNTYKLKMFSVCGVQTDFSETSCDTQTGQSLLLDFLSNTPVQTDVIKQLDVSNQTETSEQSSFEVQTDEPYPIPSPVSDNSAQTEKQNSDEDLIHFCSQTDLITVEQTCTQTESQSLTQTEKETIDHSSVQTDSVIHGQSSTQTEETMSDQSRILTGSVIQGSDLDESNSCAAKLSDSVSGNKAGSTTTDSQTDDNETFSSIQDYEKVIADLEAKHRQEMSDLIAKLEKEKEDSLQLRSSLTSLAGDKQVKFNEAVSRAVGAKERVIEELRNREREMEEELRTNKEMLDKLREEKAKADDVKERALSLLQDKEREFSANQRRWESDLLLGEQQLEQYKEQLQIMSVSASPSVVQIVDPDEPSLHQKIKDLEDTVRLKDEEIVRMEQKLMEYSMTASTRSLVQDKVSIMSCHVGDLVLLCLDERLDHYVVFTVGTTLHFLHTDCLTSLGLKPNPGENKKQWSIAEVTDKEYCQAKKPNNRFKVPVGTKFYRVKARPWSRDSSSSSGGATSTKPTEPTPGPS